MTEILEMQDPESIKDFFQDLLDNSEEEDIQGRLAGLDMKIYDEMGELLSPDFPMETRIKNFVVFINIIKALNEVLNYPAERFNKINKLTSGESADVASPRDRRSIRHGGMQILQYIFKLSFDATKSTEAIVKEIFVNL